MQDSLHFHYGIILITTKKNYLCCIFLTIQYGQEMTKKAENQVKKGNEKMLFISKLIG